MNKTTISLVFVLCLGFLLYLELGTTERASPTDRVLPEQIHVYQDKIVLDVQGASWGVIQDTNSMDPILDKESNTFLITPRNEEDVTVGDIITYRHEDKLIIHRVINISTDDKGIYYVLQGDNNMMADNKKVRFSDIQGIVIAVVY